MTAPLSGIRVMDLGSFLAAPYASAILATLGADVVKVEPLPPGEAYRRGRGVDDEYFVQYNAGKRSLSIDLKRPESREITRRLLLTCDALVHNLRPGKAEKLGLGYAQAAVANPRLVYAAVSGWGSLGDLSQRPGYDSTAESLSGLYSVLSTDGSFEAGGLPLADTTTGVFTALGVCAGLARRRKTGRGGLVETSLFEVAITLASERLAHRIEGGDDEAPPYPARAQTYTVTCSDGQGVTIALGDSEAHWSALINSVAPAHRAALAPFATLSYGQRVRAHTAILSAIREAMLDETSATVLAGLTARDVPAARVRTYRSAMMDDPTTRANMLRELPGRVHLVRPGFSSDGTRPNRGDRVPRIGEDTLDLLTELGLGDHAEAMLADRIVHAPGQEDAP